MDWKDEPATLKQLLRIEEYQRVYDIQFVIDNINKGIASEIITSYCEHGRVNVIINSGKARPAFLDYTSMKIRGTNIQFKDGCVLPDIPDNSPTLTDRERRDANEQVEIDFYSDLNYHLDHPDGFDPDTFCIMPH